MSFVRNPTIPLGVVLCMTIGACEPSGEVREWTPDDHSQPTKADPARVPDEAPKGDPKKRAAAALYRMSCANCHGNSGDGNGMSKPPGVTMADFRDAKWQASRTDAELTKVITEGKGVMPKFGEQINPMGVAALVEHIRAFAVRPADQPEKAEKVAK